MARSVGIWMVYAFAVAVIGACLAPRSVQAQVGSARSAEGGVVEYLWTEPKGTDPYPLILYLDGSGCRSITSVVAFAPLFVDLGFAVALPEKRGVRVDDDGRQCSDEYLRTNDRLQRVRDAAAVLEQAHRDMARWDGRLVVAGASEGAAVAPQVALGYPATIALISLGGGGWTQAEELRRLEQRKTSADNQRKALADLDRMFEEIRQSPVPDRTWLGGANTFKRWASFLSYAPVDDLVRINAPVFVAQGTRDDSVPVEGADAIASQFSSLGKTNLTYRRYDGLDHNWNDPSGKPHVRRVLEDVIEWLRSKVAARSG